MKKILLTAFEPFAGETLNSSLEAARCFNNLQIKNASIQVVELPVVRFRATEIAIDRIKAENPDIVLMLGEAGRRYRVTPERVAINLDDFRIPDNADNKPEGEPIIENGPVGYFSTLPLYSIVDRLNKAHIPAEISNSAGLYLCNRLFYNVMHYITVQQLATNAGFVHLPYLHEQVENKDRCVPSLSKETLTEAIRLTLEVTVNECS